ncbi:ribonuclease M5 [Evansella tamaricis]|uniref:Ribonuclease M5 n=1 Tax=Evansella tamaricis TaxID=2069301 RepID=A0ABS6JAF4_9BACI|nr:ribonuclease M5 [Evansella tamaricis]MBU9710154.1 ribonuclease M5 [Evansella tamaricis]
MNPIKEIIVVEGKSDTNVLKAIIPCDTIETNGSAVHEEVISQVRLAKERRGVIIFTDPDYPGEKIRKKIEDAVPGCKHAFLPKSAAIDIRKKKVGVEHASKEEILKALHNVKVSIMEEFPSEITKDDLYSAGLIAGTGAKEKREKLGDILKIGYTNGKQLWKRLIQFQITKSEFENALHQISRELENDE